MTWGTRLEEKLGEIAEALKRVEKCKQFTRITQVADPPCTIVGPPRLVFESISHTPTEAELPIYVVVANTDRAFSALYELLPRVTELLDGVEDVVIDDANPTTFPGAAAAPLPAYVLDVKFTI